LLSAFQQLGLDSAHFFVLTLFEEYVSQDRQGSQPGFILAAKAAAEVPSRAFQKWTRMRDLAVMAKRQAGLHHQMQGLKVTRAKQALVAAERGQHARQIVPTYPATVRSFHLLISTIPEGDNV
jgi:hypothetical protein